MLTRSLFLLAAIAPFTFADVEFTSPSGGATIAGGSTIKVQWKESGNDPPIDDLQTYELFLCAGGSDPDSFIQLTAIQAKGQFASGNSASGTIQANLGGKDKNAYFLKMISASTTGTVVNYSDRFTLSGMTGTFPPNVQAGLKDIKGTDGPKAENNINDQAAAGGGAVGDATIPYTMQTGATKFAPMQKQPGTKITAKNPSPKYPTSQVELAKTALPTPKQVTTITQSGTFQVSSRENTASPAPMPMDAMQKFLNRWRD